jgi:hypothetical protein
LLQATQERCNCCSKRANTGTEVRGGGRRDCVRRRHLSHGRWRAHGPLYLRRWCSSLPASSFVRTSPLFQPLSCSAVWPPSGPDNEGDVNQAMSPCRSGPLVQPIIMFPRSPCSSFASVHPPSLLPGLVNLPSLALHRCSSSPLCPSCKGPTRRAEGACGVSCREV